MIRILVILSMPALRMGHKTDAMDIRYGVVEDDDVVEAGSKLNRTFQAFSATIMRVKTTQNRSATSIRCFRGVARGAGQRTEDKLKAMVALLRV
jgi:hypothetical protein